MGQQLLSSLNEGIFIINEWVGVVSYSIILNLISEVVSPRISISWDGWPIKALLHFSARDGNAVSSLGYALCKSGKTDPTKQIATYISVHLRLLPLPSVAFFHSHAKNIMGNTIILSSRIFYKAILHVQTNTLFVQVPLSYFLLMYLCTIKIADDQTNDEVFISGV